MFKCCEIVLAFVKSLSTKKSHQDKEPYLLLPQKLCQGLWHLLPQWMVMGEGRVGVEVEGEGVAEGSLDYCLHLELTQRITSEYLALSDVNFYGKAKP